MVYGAVECRCVPGLAATLPIEWDAGWTPASVWTLRRREKSVVLDWNRVTVPRSLKLYQALY